MPLTSATALSGLLKKSISEMALLGSTFKSSSHEDKNNVLKILLEDKTYLDVCYLKRCVLDFMELDQSPDVPDDVEYAIFAGQNAVGKDALAYYPAYFEKYTHKKLNMFFVNPQYKRNSKRPIYKEQFRSHFDLDMTEYNRFIEWLQK
jgi:hypothetical protein